MKTGKKRLTGTLLALCAALLVLCIVLAIGWSKTEKADAVLPEVRNNGTAVQWKYRDETDWRDLVALTELTGAAGENGRDGANGENGTDGKNGINGTNGKDGMNGVDGTDGQNGIDGKDGMNAKNIEVQRAATHIQWRYEGDEWQNLVAIADIEGPAGQNGTDGANGKTPEFRVSENILQWRYVGDEIWLNLYDLTTLKGADGRDGVDGKDGINGKDGAAGKDGTNGQNGSDGKDGKTPFIGENGNWWIGEIDTAVKAAGIDGTDGVDGDKGEKGDPGEKGDKGDPGEKGDKGDKGDPGQNGGSLGYFAANGRVYSWGTPLPFNVKKESGDLISYDASSKTITLSKGHTYSMVFSGTVMISANGNYKLCGASLIDGYNSSEMMLETRTYVSMIDDGQGARLGMSYNTIYRSEADIALTFQYTNMLFQNTNFTESQYNITIIALD